MNKQIEEMAKCCPFLKNGKCQGDSPIETDCDLMCKMFGFITNLIQADYLKQEWISVEERLPSKSGLYVVYSRFENTLCLEYSVVHKMFNCFDSHSKKEAIGFSIAVTHWMPLPKVPKKGDKTDA